MTQTEKKTATKQVKRKAAAVKEEEEYQKLIKVIEKKIFKPKVSIKHGDTEAPSFEIEFIKNIVYLMKPLMQDIRDLLD